MGKVFRKNDLAARWGVSLSTLEKRPDDQLPARLQLPGSRLWRCREQELLEFEARCVAGIASNDDEMQPQAQKAENNNKRGRPAKPPVSDRGRRTKSEE